MPAPRSNNYGARAPPVEIALNEDENLRKADREVFAIGNSAEEVVGFDEPLGSSEVLEPVIPLQRPLRIALISTPFLTVPPKNYGGTELVIYELAEGLAEAG